jgi:hypothetical protein
MIAARCLRPNSATLRRSAFHTRHPSGKDADARGNYKRLPGRTTKPDRPGLLFLFADVVAKLRQDRLDRARDSSRIELLDRDQLEELSAGEGANDF